jgi:hypothetical protein
MQADVPTIITVAFIPAIVALFGICGALVRAIIAYLRDENKTLKTERDGVLATLVGAVDNQQEAITATGEFVRDLAGQQEYERRKANERRGGGV